MNYSKQLQQGEIQRKKRNENYENIGHNLQSFMYIDFYLYHAYIYIYAYRPYDLV